MATEIKSELSKKNENWIPKERFLELKHFCHQYDYWKKMLPELTSLEQSHIKLANGHSEGEHSDPVAKCTMKRIVYQRNIDIVEKAAWKSDPGLAKYLLVGVIRGQKYNILKARLEIPCTADTYYIVYRRFFKILDELRG